MIFYGFVFRHLNYKKYGYFPTYRIKKNVELFNKLITKHCDN